MPSGIHSAAAVISESLLVPQLPQSCLPWDRGGELEQCEMQQKSLEPHITSRVEHLLVSDISAKKSWPHGQVQMPNGGVWGLENL